MQESFDHFEKRLRSVQSFPGLCKILEQELYADDAQELITKLKLQPHCEARKRVFLRAQALQAEDKIGESVMLLKAYVHDAEIGS
jgi:hypothetical protein